MTKLTHDMLASWHNLRFLRTTYPLFLADCHISSQTIVADLLALWRQPPSLEAVVEGYLEAGELQAARAAADGESQERKRVVGARCDERLQQLTAEVDARRRALATKVRVLQSVGLDPAPLNVRVQESKQLESKGRLGPAIHVLCDLDEWMDAWRRHQLEHIARSAAELKHRAETGERRPSLDEAIGALERFLERADLVNAQDALRIVERMLRGQAPPTEEIQALVVRSRLSVSRRVLRELPQDVVDHLETLVDVDRWLSCLNDSTREPTGVPAGFAALWSAALKTDDAASREKLLRAAAAAYHDSGPRRRQTHLPEMLKALQTLAQVITAKATPREETWWESSVQFKDPHFGPAELQQRRATRLYITLAPNPARYEQVFSSEAVHSGNPHQLRIIITPVKSPQLQEACRHSAANLVALDALSLLRVALSPDPGAAFFCEVIQQLDPLTVSPYSEKGITTGYMFRGRLAELKRFAQRSESYILFGGRMMGKTSLLVKTAEWLSDRGWTVAQVSCEPLRDPRTRKVEPLELCRALVKELKEKAVKINAPAHFLSAVLDWLGKDPKRQVAFFIDEIDDFLDADRDGSFAVCAVFRELFENASVHGRVRFFFAGFKKLYEASISEAKPLTRFAKEAKIGPLDETAANELIREPLELMGIHFTEMEEANLLAEIQNFTSNHPSLVQMFCGLLVERVAARKAAPKHTITSFDVAEVYHSERYREHVLFTLRKNYEPIQELIVALAALDIQKASAAQQGFSVEDTQRELLRWLGDQRWGWKDLLTSQRIQVWLKELTAMRVLDGTEKEGYRFALSVYPRILSERTKLEDRVLELVEQFEREGPSRAGIDSSAAGR